MILEHAERKWEEWREVGRERGRERGRTRERASDAQEFLPSRDVRPVFIPSQSPYGTAAAAAASGAGVDKCPQMLTFNTISGGQEQEQSAVTEGPLPEEAERTGTRQSAQIKTHAYNSHASLQPHPAFFDTCAANRICTERGDVVVGQRSMSVSGCSTLLYSPIARAARTEGDGKSNARDEGKKRLKNGKASESVEREREEWRRRVNEREAARESERAKKHQFMKSIGKC